MRSIGRYSNRARGKRAHALMAQDPATKPAASVEYVSKFATRPFASVRAWAPVASCRSTPCDKAALPTRAP